jgi:small-conductance mechanosensitive channel
MDWLRSTLNSLPNWRAWLPDPVLSALILALALVIALILHGWLRHLARRLLAKRYPLVFSVITQMRGVTRLGLLILALIVAIPAAPIGAATAGWMSRLLLVAMIVLVGWSAITAMHIAADLYLRRFNIDRADNLLARKHITQIRVLLRSGDVLIVIVTIACALMTFDAVRQYGVSLFASAGVAGIVAGFAARPVLSNLFAGVQLAMTQPIRIDDAVVVEGEWGTIEEITSTYVVVRIWDWRRLIVPLSYFIEKPFQNWTRESAALIGTVLFYLDYRAPIGAMREKLKEICAHSKNWNGDVLALQVTNCKDWAIEVRAIMSGNSGGQTWDLRCEVREKMLDFLQREHPEALPRQRNELAATGAAGRIAHIGGDPVGALPETAAGPKREGAEEK